MVVITPDSRQLAQERAVAAVLSALPLYGLGLGLLLRIPGISWLVRAGYVAFAARRHEVSAALGLGRCGVPRPLGGSPAAELSSAELPPRVPRLWPDVWLTTSIAAREALVVLALIMTCNELATDNDWARRHFPGASQPAALLAFVDTFRLYQGWRMFAPEPPYEDGKMVVDARTVDGRKVDPLTGQEPDFNPETHVGWGHDQFWCDYHLKMSFEHNAPYRQHLKEYLERWPQRTGRARDRLVAFNVWWISDKSPPPGALHGKPGKPVKLASMGEVKDSGATPWL